jgi:2-methylisocitrate lyase-like PEP mutase family enzyme
MSGTSGASDAAALRALHVPGTPLVLPNAWDPASARLVERAGFPVIATSSGAVARAAGSEDHEVMTADEALGHATRIIEAVGVPVTVDFEAGYGLAPDAIAYGLLSAGAAGCNLEDTDHRAPGTMVDAATNAARLAAVRAAAGDALVINARVDTFLHRVPNPVEEAIERGKRYLDAGADCIYPIAAADDADIERLVAALGVINVMLRPGAPTVGRCAELGVARVSTAAGLFKIMTSQVRDVLTRLREGDDTDFLSLEG